MQRSQQSNLWELRHPDACVQQWDMGRMGDLHWTRGLRPHRDAELRHRRDPDVHEWVCLGRMSWSDLHRVHVAGVWELRHPVAHMHQRNLGRLGDLHRGRRLHGQYHPSLRFRGNANMPKHVPVGRLHAMHRIQQSNLRQLRHPVAHM